MHDSKYNEEKEGNMAETANRVFHGVKVHDHYSETGGVMLSFVHDKA